MSPLRLSLTLALLIAGAGVAQPPALIDLTAVRSWNAAGVSRIAIELSGEAHYAAGRLSGPERVFLDIRETQMKLASKGLNIIKVEDGLVTRVRVGPKDARSVRVVLDLAPGALEYQVSQLANPYRIIVEVRAKDAKPPVEPPAPEITSPAPAPVEEPAAPAPVPAKPADEPKPAAGAAPQPAGRLSNGQRDMTRVLGLKLGRVVIDPGHGGHDQGTNGPTGLLEKELVLEVSRRLAELLKEQGVAEVVLTREADVYVGLEERPAIANRQRADLFLSIHANSSPVKGISGAETYFLNFTNVKADLDVASRENASTQKSIFELREVLQRIALRDKMDESREFAQRVQNFMAALWSKSNDAAYNRGVKKAPFVVLIGTTMPAILAEIGFVNNPKDEVLLKKPEFRQKIAEALAQGVANYASTLSRREVASKERR